MQELAVSLWRGICVLPNLVQDLIVYSLAALFAGVNSVYAGTADYREWGTLATAPYLVAGAFTFALYLLHRRRPISVSMLRRARISVVVLLGVTTVVVPLLSELVWRATATQNAHAQPEVAVIERAGDRIALGRSPYLLHPSSVGISPTNDSHGVDQFSFFPYLPGMAIFGLLNATAVSPEIGDARVLFALVALATFFVALSLTRASPERKIRATQFFVALPVGALPMVTGGDDLPVIALVLLSLALLQRRQGFASGILAALACSLKFTAWPIALLALLISDHEEDSHLTRSYLAGLSLVIPVLLFGLYGNVQAFVENVIRFPLGLTRVRSPAASPLLGQFLVSAFPHQRRLITLLLAIAGSAIVVVAITYHRPRDAAGVARFSGFALCVATVLAPATRFGYLIYPTLLFIWSYVLTGYRRPHLDDQRAAAG
ncbi:MAG TPA: glycosyltransferase 87 family protein [Acidimicrobiales bacterium]|nr:glycosyltransferase 87 family protein [Acidimicrobiales bacterium]